VITIEQLYRFIKQFPEDRVCKNGFTNPHSYRGYYDEVAFEPVDDVTVKHMLDCIHRAINETFHGWKGGEYRYEPGTPVHIAFQGCCSEDEDDIPSTILLSIAGIEKSE
jgi:hypothetical protein